MKFMDIFKDMNDHNEKTIIGAVSFMIMAIIAIVNTIMAILGKPFVINEYIYNSFTIITLGAFGIAEVGKVAKVIKDETSGGSMDNADDIVNGADATTNDTVKGE